MRRFYQRSKVQWIIYPGEGECFFPVKHRLVSAPSDPILRSGALSPPLLCPIRPRVCLELISSSQAASRQLSENIKTHEIASVSRKAI